MRWTPPSIVLGLLLQATLLGAHPALARSPTAAEDHLLRSMIGHQACAEISKTASGGSTKISALEHPPCALQPAASRQETALEYGQSAVDIAPDPSGYKDSVNLYAFAGNDPVNGRDPTGTNEAETLAKKALKWLAKRAKTTVSAHIRKRHVQQLEKYAEKSAFKKGAQTQKLVMRTLRGFDPARVVFQKNGNVVFQKQFQREIGKGGERFLRVVVNGKTGKIITSHTAGKFLTALLAAGGGAAVDQSLAEASEAGERARARHEDESESGWNWITPLGYDVNSTAWEPSQERIRDLQQRGVQKAEQELSQSLAPDAAEDVRRAVADAYTGESQKEFEDANADDDSGGSDEEEAGPGE